MTDDERKDIISRARQHVYDLADGKARWTMEVPPRAITDSDLLLLAPCDIAEALMEERDRLHDRFRDVLAAPAEPAEPAENDRAQVEALGVLSPQPPPTNTEGDVWQELIDITAEGPVRNLMIERRAQGIAKYGRPLGRDNGRDHNADAIQEAVDGMVYAHADRNEDARVAFTDTLRILLGEVSPSAAGWVHRSDYLQQEARAAAYAEVLARYGSDTGPAGNEALMAERDRLRDILDCETGKRAPEGWTFDFVWRDGVPVDFGWHRGDDYVESAARYDEPGWRWGDERFDYALEAIEAADRAAKENA